MHYFGGKKRIAKELSLYLKKFNSLYSTYLEPFVGSASVMELLDFKLKVGTDNNKYLIAMFNALQDGWVPPEFVTREEYYRVKENKDEDLALTGFVGIACSFSGKWFGGYAGNGRGRNYARDGKNTLLKQIKKIEGVEFIPGDYSEIKACGALIYCDPPYKNTTEGYISRKFDHGEFWEVVREWSKDNLVFVSEYQAPEDFTCIKEIETRTDIRDKSGKMIPRIERLFIHESYVPEIGGL